jgi:serine/threonine-protein kinase
MREDHAAMEQPDPARTCPVCRRASPPDARFCAGCGHRFIAEEGAFEVPIADPLIGRIIADRYRIDQLLGRGGMGIVYRVEHVRMGKLMAMKLLHGALAHDRDVRMRFRREAEAASKLDHPNTVQVFDFGYSEGLMYLVMELLGGRDLATVLDTEGPLPFDRVARIAVQICGSVGQAHARGIVHRDLKPENIRVLTDPGEPDFVKVMDFGLAKLRESREEAANASVTRAGFIIGTPYYMAPEQIRGESPDPRTDIYALGALMYKCLTGEPPFWAPTPVGVLTKHLTDPLVPPSQRRGRWDLPPEADAIIARAMAKDPRDRFASMDELRAELASFLRARQESAGSQATERPTLPTLAYELTRSGRRVEVATRADVDRYERRLRIQAWVVRFVVLGVLGALVAAGTWALYRWRPGAHPEAVSEEVEPNDTPALAALLPEGRSVRGYLGRRSSPERGDADVWMLDRRGGGKRVVRIEFSGLPNMDTVLEIFRAGQSDPLVVVDAGGVGSPESVPNFVLQESTRYLVRVREVWEVARYPTENVSDAYVLSWTGVDPEPGDEREVNDTLSLAESIPPGEMRRGYIGWQDDVDVFCLSRDAERVVAVLEPVRSLDLVLRHLDRTTGHETIYDAGRIGAGESSAEIARASAGTTCFSIAARVGDGVPSSDPNERWTLRLISRAEERGAP